MKNIFFLQINWRGKGRHESFPPFLKAILVVLEINVNNTVKNVTEHLRVEGLSLSITLPFYICVLNFPVKPIFITHVDLKSQHFTAKYDEFFLFLQNNNIFTQECCIFKNIQPHEKFIMRQLVLNFTDFWRNNSDSKKFSNVPLIALSEMEQTILVLE